MPAAASVRIQVVLFGNDLAQLWRLTSAVAAAGRQARQIGLLGHLELAFGDCTPAPLLPAADREQLAARARRDGIDLLTYEFFAANLGSAGGTNRLAQDASADYLLVLNPDTYPAPDMLARLLEVVRDPSIGIVEARQIPLEHPKHFDLTTGDTSWASGCCLLVPRAVFVEVGGFDTEHFFLHCDDVDFSWRVRLTGRRVVHVPSAAVFHDKRIDVDGHVVTPRTETYYGTLGRLMLARRYDCERVLTETLAWCEQHGTDAHQQAAAQYRRLEAAGTLPAALPRAASVAEFIGQNYALHRF